MPEPIVYLNGEFVPASQAKLNIYDLGIVLGATMAEMTRTFAHRPFRLEDHVARLYRSCKYAGFKLVGVRPGTFYRAVGIRSGDVVREISGQVIDAPNKALLLYTKLKQDPKVTLVIERRGRLMTLRLDMTQVKSPPLCTSGATCTEAGACADRKDHRCTWPATSAADCAKPAGTRNIVPCKATGRCTAREGRCVAAQDADCRASADCEGLGLCSAANGRCVASKVADCQGSVVCKRLGHCRPLDNNCVSGRAPLGPRRRHIPD